MARKKRNNLIFIDNGYKHPVKKRRHRRNIFQKISFKSYFMLLLLVLIVSIGYVFSPLGHVSQISVKGTNYIGAQQIIDASKISNDSLVVQTLFQKRTICRQIKRQVPLVKKVDYHYDNLNHLKITVQEYQTVGFLLKKDGYYRILENSQILHSKLQQPIGNFPIYQDFGSKTSLQRFVQLYLHLSLKLRNDISEIHGESKNQTKHPYRVMLYMNDGNIIIGDIRTLKSKLRYYPEIAHQMQTKGIVNLEVGAYSRPFPKKN
ncbi:hypothetical protein DS830_03840 [Bombilactobacillus bombi]|uniref:cell division protein FtsQ/DivIB n=1 Tax=Bombilactobacillus bombi TaxID=1303590 RepID=UPI000E57C138|nr:FtsQ-type POTRA domain-containing protein [Bombilactobacillus bombi]AXX64648.1 hypothetical protein DS830_03840 [Bombilactobacillus bombi]